MQSNLYIRNMTCRCCTEVVKTLLEKLDIVYTFIEPGVVGLKDPLCSDKHLRLGTLLKNYGLELFDDHRILITERIKKLIVDIVYNNKEQLQINLSDYLSGQLQYNYNYLSNVFRLQEGKTIESFIKEQKIQRAKELLTLDGLSPNETALRLNYSSLAHLSRQFKEVTGLTPSLYKKNHQKNPEKV
jgi:AraC-like DNA-binding protein